MALIKAAQRGDSDTVSHLLTLGPWSNTETWCALSTAAANDWSDTVSVLLAAKINPNHTARVPAPFPHVNIPTSTALFWASSFGAAASAARLLEYGAHIEGCGASWRSTALGIASRKGHAGVVKTLLAAKARHDGYVCFGGCNPLAEATENGHKAVVALLKAASSFVTPASPATPATTPFP